TLETSETSLGARRMDLSTCRISSVRRTITATTARKRRLTPTPVNSRVRLNQVFRLLIFEYSIHPRGNDGKPATPARSLPEIPRRRRRPPRRTQRRPEEL